MKNHIKNLMAIFAIIFVLIVMIGVPLHTAHIEDKENAAGNEACYPAQVVELYRFNSKGTKNVVALCAPLTDAGAPQLVRKAWE